MSASGHPSPAGGARARRVLIIIALGVVLAGPLTLRSDGVAAANAPFTCTSWQTARQHVLAGEALEAKGKTADDHKKATDEYKKALTSCQDYPWAYSDLQQSYGDLHQFTDSSRYGWQAIEAARRTKDRWAWSADEYRAFMAGCFDNLGWVEQVQASALGPNAKAYKTGLTTALEHYRKALFYNAADNYALKHSKAIEAYLAART